MARGQLDVVLRHLRNTLIAKDAEDLADPDLVHRFVDRRDEAAFTVLVRRHGGMVYSVCRHLLSRDADAEDAFQATFLILARKAASIKRQTSLASWLHGVAYRSAMNLRKSAMRRRKHEETLAAGHAPESPVSIAAMNELQAYLDEAIECLPEIYRGNPKSPGRNTTDCSLAVLRAIGAPTTRAIRLFGFGIRQPAKKSTSFATLS